MKKQTKPTAIVTLSFGRTPKCTDRFATHMAMIVPPPYEFNQQQFCAILEWLQTQEKTAQEAGIHPLYLRLVILPENQGVWANPFTLRADIYYHPQEGRNPWRYVPAGTRTKLYYGIEFHNIPPSIEHHIKFQMKGRKTK